VGNLLCGRATYSHGAFEMWKKNDGITEYTPKEIILKEMEDKIE
jgi:hypothetical protein